MKRLIAIALLIAACSREETVTTATVEAKPAAPLPPTADDARKVIQSSAELGEYEFTDAAWSLPVAGSMMNEPQRAAARDLARAGWLTIERSGDATLTEKARNDKRFLLRPNGLLDIVPLAKKEMGNVVAVRANPDGSVAADFTWRWIPNEVAAAFLRDKFEGTRESTATLMHNGTEWIVLKIAPR